MNHLTDIQKNELARMKGVLNAEPLYVGAEKELYEDVKKAKQGDISTIKLMAQVAENPEQPEIVRAVAVEQVIASGFDVVQNATVEVVTPFNPVELPFKVGEETFATLKEAFAVGSVITLVGDANTDGTIVESGKTLDLDLCGYTMCINAPTVGSAGTETNGMQLLKDSTVTIKNGTIKSEVAKILLQNYCNLTLDKVTLIGNSIMNYVLSNNCGKITLKNGTKIQSNGSKVAFDVYYGMSAAYDAGVSVTIADNSVVVDGAVEYGKASRASVTNFDNNASLIIPGGYALNVPGVVWVAQADGTQKAKALSYGTVTTITAGGAVNGDGTANTEVVFKDTPVTLNFSPADTSIGRNEDGWWVGIKAIAPANADIANAVYQSYNYKEGVWSANKSFNQNKDGANYIELWGWLNEELVAKSVESGEPIARSWRFDWNNCGVFGHAVTMLIYGKAVTLTPVN